MQVLFQNVSEYFDVISMQKCKYYLKTYLNILEVF